VKTRRLISIINAIGIASGMLLSHGALAAPTADFRLRADMLPVSCDVTISNNGVVDFGTIYATNLSDTTYTNAGVQHFSLTLTCDSAAQVAVTASDGRKGTTAAGIGRFLFGNQNDASTFGVGSVDGHNVGGYLLYREDAATADGAAVDSIVSNNNGVSWAKSADANNAMRPDTRMHGWAPSGTIAPGSYVTITQPYKIKLALNRKSDLPDLTRAVPIDGLATFTVTYL